MVMSGCNLGRHILISIASDGVDVDEVSAICPKHYMMTGNFDAETKGIAILRPKAYS